MIDPNNIDIKKIIQRLMNTSLAVSILGASVLILVFFSMCFIYIKPYEYGIKQVNIGLKRGIQEKEYTTGLHFIMPFGFERMHTFPKNIQMFELTDNPLNRRLRNGKSANIQTSDGFFVNVDVSILYHIKDAYKVMTQIGPGTLYIDNGILPKAEPVLKDTLGKLTTEEFYNPHLRVAKMELAKEKLKQELLPKGIGVDQILIRYFRYSSEIQRNIEEKKLKDQLVFKNQAEAKAAIEAAQLAKTVEEGEAMIKIELEKGNAYVVKKNAEAELYGRKKRAWGKLLIDQAEAEKTRLKNLALKGKGSDNIVGLKMAEVLKGIDLLVLPSDGKTGVNPLNLDKMLGLMQ